MNVFINILLLPLFLIYQLFMLLRNFLYDIKLLTVVKLPCKVISVGNIAVGGTGKTPMVIALANLLQKQNKNVAILSRGYGRKTSGTQIVSGGKTLRLDWESAGDEPVLMARQLPGIPIVVDENRVRGGKILINKFHPDIILLDDGFQHRKLFRDIDIVLINSNMSKFINRIYGFNTFRELWGSLTRANLIFITKSNLTVPSAKLLTKLKSSGLPVINTIISAESFFVDSEYKQTALSTFRGKTAILFSGIGDPESFVKAIQNSGIKVLDSISFRDHKKYSALDIETIHTNFIKNGADIIITTEKDFLKLGEISLPIFAMPISTQIDTSGYDQILNLLD